MMKNHKLHILGINLGGKRGGKRKYAVPRLDSGHCVVSASDCSSNANIIVALVTYLCLLVQIDNTWQLAKE